MGGLDLNSSNRSSARLGGEVYPELELELVEPQKPVLRGEVGCACVAREVSVERGGMVERGCTPLSGWL